MNAPLQLDVRALQTRLFGAAKVPDAEQWRMYYGNGVSPERVESVIRAAQYGYMRDLTDLAYETVAVDPHLGSILGKRFRAIAAVEYDVTAASGPGVDPEPAAEIADLARQALARIENFRDGILSLEWGHFDARASVEKQWVYDPADPIPWTIRELSWIHPRRLSFGPEREMRLNDDLWGGSQFEARGFDLRSVPYKWVQFRPRLFNDYPEREGLAPRCLYFSLFKRFSWRERLILLEVFGKPWRIVWVPDPSTAMVQDEQLDQAQESVDQMGSNATGVLPPGIALQTDQPHPDSGNMHRDIAQEADDQNSLLVLGNKRTSDAKPGALGSSADDVAKGEQDGVTMSDAWNIAEVIRAQIVRDIVILNRGVGALKYLPKITPHLQAAPDRTAEIARTKQAVDIGIPIKTSQIYERCGFEQPAPGDQVLLAGGGIDAFGNQKVKIGILGNEGEVATDSTGAGSAMSEAVSALVLAPTDVAKVVRVREARASQGLSPFGDERDDMTLAQLDAWTTAQAQTPVAPVASPAKFEDLDADGTPDEPPSDESASALAASMTQLQIPACEHGKKNRCHLCGIERDRRVELDADGTPIWPIAWKPIGGGRVTMPAPGSAATIEASLRASVFARAELGEHICLARQPDTIFGSPESLIDKGAGETAKITAKWADVMGAATEGLDSVPAIRAALKKAAKTINVDAFAAAAERRILHGVMLGALDSTWERENEEPVASEAFSRIRMMAPMDAAGPVTTRPRFAEQPLDAALRFFREKQILRKADFDRLSAAAKRRAFTIARLARQDLLETAHAELARMIEAGKDAMVPGTHEGPDLRQFRKFMAERIESAGWTPANKSHVELIYRNNVMSAYSAGRRSEMTQPAVLAMRPYWQIRGVKDDRTRETHREAQGVVLRASDPFWKKAFPPFGHNCFMPDTIVRGSFVGASKVLYRGKAVELVTAKGRRLTVTANHPILTPTGFVPASTLREGMDLVCYGGEPGVELLRLGAQGDEHDKPARADEVFRSLSNASMGLRSHAGADDFHGEARFFDGDVEVVGTYGDLLRNGFPQLAEQAENVGLEPADLAQPLLRGSSASHQFGTASLPTPAGGPGCSALPLYARTVRPQDAPLHTLRCGSSAEDDAVVLEDPTENLAADVHLSGQLLQRLPGKVSTDKVSSVREFDVSTHVHDLQTVTGWIVASGIVSSNCRCRAISRSESWVKRTGATVGPAPSGVPDDGWDTSSGSL